MTSMLYAFSWLLLLLLVANAKPESEECKTYIIHVDHSQKPSILTHESWHLSILQSTSNSADKQNQLLYSYKTIIHGFSARLTPFQVSEIKKSPDHVAIHEEYYGKLLTTHTPKFFGLRHSSGLWPTSSYGEGIIIGLIDTGVWPESASFNDKGMPPIPQRWKGKCENSKTRPFPCNKKLIGARTFIKSIQAKYPNQTNDSPRDHYGHGTHTLSTAGGNHVAGASHFGYASGTTRGIAPHAHLAMYKVSNINEMAASDVLAAMDQGIADGIDIMSISLAFDQRPYFKDAIAIGSLSAYDKGIVVVSGTGNEGTYSISNVAPWILTVGVGTIDRSLIGTVTLGNGLTFEGTSTFSQSVLITDASFYYSRGDSKKTTCQPGSLNRNESIGKVIFCDYDGITMSNDQLAELYRIRASAAIVLIDQIFSGALDNLAIPIMIISLSSGNLVREYVKGEPKPKVMYMRFVLTNLGTKPVPEVASFSSRGPNPITPGILKPNVIAPGVNVLVAFPPIPKIRIGDYALVTDYALYSGTSMATPHVAGVAALLKASSNNWSPAAIRSALMTTAYTINNNGTTLTNQYYVSPATPLDYGAVHINPNKALDPRLIYDLDTQDYINFLCGLGYKVTEMRAVLR
ncbi:hypothetical protein V6N13_054016 [Hibiscus sabdariffa]